MGIRAIVGVLTCTICLMATTTASAQSETRLQPALVNVGRINSAPGRLQKAASEAGADLARLNRAVPQQSSRTEKSNALAVGAAIGAAAGVTAGLVQPTHSNGEYVWGNSRATSALVLGGVGAGIGALIGFVIDRAR